MRIAFEFGADPRNEQGKGASRRLRRAGKVPAVLYGGNDKVRNLVLDQANLLTMIDNEKFYSSIVSLRIGEQKQPAIVKDVQMHPARNIVVHVDLQRVVETEKIRLHIPVHFSGEAVAPGVKTEGGVVSHLMADVLVSCLPKDLPEFIQVDMSNMHLNDTIRLADLPAPDGVVFAEIAHGRNPPVVSIHAPRAAEPEPEVAAAAAMPAEGAAAAPAEGAAAAPAAAGKAAEPAAGAKPAAGGKPAGTAKK